MLEDMCLAGVATDPRMECASKFLECVKQAGIEVKNQSKALANCFLAGCEDPTVPVGVAGLKGYWNWSAPCWTRIKDFLRKLGEPAEAS